MVPIVSFFLLRKHKQFYTQFILDLLLFISSISVSVFIKFFLIQKSKSTNLKHKELKQEEATVD